MSIAKQFTSLQNASYLAIELDKRGHPQQVFADKLKTFMDRHSKQQHDILQDTELWAGVRHLNQLYIDTHSFVKSKPIHSATMINSQIIFAGTPQLPNKPDDAWDDNSGGGFRTRTAQSALDEFVKRDNMFIGKYAGPSRKLVGQVNKKLINNIKLDHIVADAVHAKSYKTNTELTVDEKIARRRRRASQYLQKPTRC